MTTHGNIPVLLLQLTTVNMSGTARHEHVLWAKASAECNGRSMAKCRRARSGQHRIPRRSADPRIWLDAKRALRCGSLPLRNAWLGRGGEADSGSQYRTQDFECSSRFVGPRLTFEGPSEKVLFRGRARIGQGPCATNRALLGRAWRRRQVGDIKGDNGRGNR